MCAERSQVALRLSTAEPDTRCDKFVDSGRGIVQFGYEKNHANGYCFGDASRAEYC